MLRDLVETTMGPQEIADLLTMAGFEVEDIVESEGDLILDVKVMANRGDGLSAMGLAREILAKDDGAQPTDLYRQSTQRFGTEGSQEASGQNSRITLQTPACTSYACMIFDDVENGPSPDWIQKRLTAAGMRPISLLVDLTNYVLLEQGQPLHAFDLDRLSGQRIVVREARQGETFVTLNGIEHHLEDGQMLICDAEKPVAVAGVMGGLESEVGPETRAMLLESAQFLPGSVRKTRKQLGLNTEASYRFERWVDPRGVTAALRRFEQLYSQATGTQTIREIEAVSKPLPEPAPIRLRSLRVEQLLGMPVREEEIGRHLSKLGFSISGNGPGEFAVIAPSWRPDCVREEDLVEEVGRVHGYEKIPEQLTSRSTTQGAVVGLPAFKDKVREVMVRCGFTQIISHSLGDLSPLDYRPSRRLAVRNPHAPDMATLRDSLLPNLASAAKRNGGRDLHIFEIGQVFVAGDVDYDESPELGILSTGTMGRPEWDSKSPGFADFYSLKGVIETLGRAVKIPMQIVAPRELDPRLHPKRQAGVMIDNERLWVGYFGQIHPDVAEEVGLPQETVLAELDLLVLASEEESELPLRAFSRNPSVQRDISFVISKAVTYKEIEVVVKRSAGMALEDSWLFDVYEGPGIEDGSHSLGLAFTLRKHGANLTDEEANQVRDSVVAELAQLGAKLR